MKRLFTELRRPTALLCCALAVIAAVGMTGCASLPPEPAPVPEPPTAPPSQVSKRVPSVSLEKYRQQVNSAVASKWKIYVKLYSEASPTGQIRFSFYVDQNGKPQDAKIIHDPQASHLALREITLRAILDAQIPPIPPDLLRTLPDGRIKIEYEARVY